MARIVYGPVRRDRIRHITNGFGWVDHRLVQDRYMQQCSVHALALYLFLICVADADGVSYWGNVRAAERLDISLEELRQARCELIDADLVAYDKPVSQILPVLVGGARAAFLLSTPGSRRDGSRTL
jgi:hypothetical protein